MLNGYVDEVCRQYVAGWAFDDDNSYEAVEVVVLVGGEERARIKADRLRPDLRDLGTFGDGRHGFLYRFDSPLSLIGSYDVVVRFASGGPVRPGRLTIGKATIGRHDDLTPILVTSTGRSGTSLMMRRLAQDKSILVAGHFPYETKLLAYYAHAFEILTAAGNHKHSLDPNTIFRDPYHIGLNPFNHQEFAAIFPRPKMIHAFFEAYSGPIVADAFKTIAAKFYARVGVTQAKTGATFFAEKCEVFHPTRDFTRSIHGKVREIILVRDPRDVFCSYRSFWSTPVDESMQILRSVRNKMLEFMREHSEDSLFVRYEDLVREPDVVLKRISEFLALDHVMAIDGEGETAEFRIHATSRDADASIGRWRQELTASELRDFDAQFGEFFEAFGYEVAEVTGEMVGGATA